MASAPKEDILTSPQRRLVLEFNLPGQSGGRVPPKCMECGKPLSQEKLRELQQGRSISSLCDECERGKSYDYRTVPMKRVSFS